MWQWAHLLGFNLYWLLAVKWQQLGPLLAMLLLHFIFSPSRQRDWRLLWLGFALTLAHGMRWLLRLPRWQQALFGVFGGASSYVAGAAMGAVNLPWGIWISTALLAVIWMWWLPVLLWVMVKLEGES
ncbi:DUF2878 domain-containing protein [Aeromonas veronii]|uniref:DUF2878 domain-containing protein n=1 Tax=Aeromonas veronii TaxID=654 RepID=UPI00211D3EAA|nr:DUF2878 domain-containing protein [Aeromonas veronii]UUM67964.1 DUF2878 domain-containing protein [Aeromonas veronii]